MWKKLGLSLVLAGLASTGMAAEDATAKDKKEVEGLIRGLYSRPINEIEGALEFHGKYDPAAGCAVLRMFFAPEMVGPDLVGGRVMNEKACNLRGELRRSMFRFPSLEEGPDEDRPRPKSKLVSSTVTGDRAVVKVNAPIDQDLQKSRVVYFLRKTDKGWRIANMLAYKKWPLEFQTEGDTCATAVGSGFDFALRPTGPEFFEDIPARCRQSWVETYGRIGWGK